MKSSEHEEIKLNGRVIPIKSAKLREAFASLQAKESEIADLKSSGADNDRLVTIQLSLVNMLDEMVQLVTKEKKEEA